MQEGSIEILMEMGSDDDKIVDVQLSESKYFYEHLRASEAKKRPAVDFFETVQGEVTPNMRAVLVDWLAEVAENNRLEPETLHLTINYIDRYLSGNPVVRERFQLLGVACMMIASKYADTGDICALHLEDYCNITYESKDEILQMESSVLNFFKFEMTAPTVRCFLTLLLPFALGDNMVNPMKLYYLVSYICELSLLYYDLLCFAPSLIAASAFFLARFLLLNRNASQKPWNLALTNYTRYQPSDLQDCVKALHAGLFCDQRQIYKLPAIRNKYSQHRYKCVAEISCPTSIPLENFDNNISSSISLDS